MMIRDQQSLRTRREVISRVLDGEVVLLDLEGSRYYGLNEVGSEAWQLLERGTTLAALIEALLSEFDVEEATLRADLDALLQDLLERGLVELAD
ncbi:MAG: PqqD family protein [Myxococcales bacterium]|nr:PqqD family protein [Myxococcales bacterium]